MDFGNYLYELRKRNNLKQSYVGNKLGISDKAISKWETGRSKPNLEQLKKLSIIYNIPLEELLYSQGNKRNINISKIVITGGPYAGKTTALTKIKNYFSTRGYIVLLVSDTTNELLYDGVTQHNCGSDYNYRLLQIKLQKAKEKVIEDAAKVMNSDKVLIVCDRGVIDSKAYIDDIEFKNILKELKTNEIKERDSYDAVFHLVSAAKGKEAYIIAKNNMSVKEAEKIDDKLISAWTGHPHFRIIDNSTYLDGKIDRLIKEIAVFLGEPEPFEIERKYLIQYPDINLLESMPNCTKVDIVQTYLKSNDDVERRVRARGIDGDYIYYLTEKRKVSNIKRVEIEKKLEQEEYLRLLMEADSRLHTIHKVRYCLSFNNQYFEIDIHPEWNSKAIMEIELRSEEQEIIIPEFISVIKEVTDDEAYKNYNMAISMPKE